MSSPLVKSLAKQTGNSVADVERKWNEAKASVKRTIKETDEFFYPKVVTVLKKMLGMKEQFLLLDKFKKLLKN